MNHKKPVRRCAVPAGSAIEAQLAGADFYDALSAPVDALDRPALAYFLDALRATPAWVDRAMLLRNRIVARLGLKDLGGMASLDLNRPAQSYRPGERVGIFTMIANGDEEALLGDDDKHLRVTLSVRKVPTEAGPTVVVTTVVHVKNWLGRLYMLPVAPAHKVIAPAVLARMARPRAAA